MVEFHHQLVHLRVWHGEFLRENQQTTRDHGRTDLLEKLKALVYWNELQGEVHDDHTRGLKFHLSDVGQVPHYFR